MCGIYGIVGNAGKQKLALARALCVLNASRGDHSAGIATVGLLLTTEIFKRADHPMIFAKSKEFLRLASADYRVLIGHTRFATHGTISDANAHPFKIGGTVGIHNGVVGNCKGMAEYTGKSFPVDSQYLIYCLDKFGHLGPAQGSLNVAYFGRKDAADLRIIRQGNPLAYAIVNHGKSYVFSSDYRHLRMALAIAGIRGKVYEFPEYTACAINIGQGENGKIGETWEEIPELPEEEAERFWTQETLLKWSDFPIPSERGTKTSKYPETGDDTGSISAWRDSELQERLERDEWREFYNQTDKNGECR